MNRKLLCRLQTLAAVALVAAAPLASAQQAAPRHFDEPVWSEFVYEKIGATPSLRLSRAEPVKAQAAPVKAAAARDFDFDLSAAREPAAPDERSAQAAPSATTVVAARPAATH